MKKTGFYLIKDKFFEDMSDPYLKGNKAGNRPHYYCFEDTSRGIYWMIPLSSQIDKYKRIVEKKEKAGKPCDIIHIVKLDDSRQSAFLIQDMFLYPCYGRILFAGFGEEKGNAKKMAKGWSG